MTEKIGFIGAGNMAEAIITGLINAEIFEPENIYISDVRLERVKQLCKKYGIGTVENNCALVKTVDTLVLSVKPQNMDDVLSEINRAVEKNLLIISIAAGITIGQIKRAVGDLAIVRVMPNTPALIGEGAAALYPCDKAKDKINKALRIFSAIGKAVVVEDEGLIDAVTAVSGSGPAYFFLLAEEMIKAAVELGLEEGLAETLVLQTARGAAMLAEQKYKAGEKPEVLRKKVTSPGGTTEAAMAVFSQNEFGRIVFSAVKAAAEKSKQLSSD